MKALLLAAALAASCCVCSLSAFATQTCDVAGSQSARNQPAATSATLTAPTTRTDGTIVVLVLAVDIAAGGDPGAPTWPAGFMQITSHFTAAGIHGSIRLSWAQKIANSEVGNYSVSWTRPGKFSWNTFTCSGNKTSSPVDKSGTNQSASTTTSLTAPALSGLAASDDLLLTVWANPGGGNTYTSPGRMTTILNNNQGNADGVFLASSYLALSGTSSSTETVTAAFGDNFEAASAAILSNASAPAGPPS
jgi:hypothetical protein